MVERISASFEVLTPLFLGEADAAVAGLRPPSFKGLLRYWYRAVAPACTAGQYPDPKQSPHRNPAFEPLIFGGTETGQCPFLLRVAVERQPAWRWEPQRVARHDQGRGRDTRNGMRYLGYPFDLLLRSERERRALAPGTRFRLECVFPRPPSVPQRRAVVAALWLLGHLGAAGSRARRGFGSLALRDWSGDLEERDDFPLLHGVQDREAWLAGWQRGRAVLEGWLGSFESGAYVHPHLGPKHRLAFLAEASPDWEQALAAMGLLLQKFRREPDYSQVKAHLDGRRPLERAPERAAFGLPLSFRYSSVRGQVTFLPYDDAQKTTLTRQGSLLQLRLVWLRDGLHPLFVRLDGAVPGEPDTPVAPERAGRPLRPARPTPSMPSWIRGERLNGHASVLETEAGAVLPRPAGEALCLLSAHGRA